LEIELVIYRRFFAANQWQPEIHEQLVPADGSDPEFMNNWFLPMGAA
jgi:hypothetical protein